MLRVLIQLKSLMDESYYRRSNKVNREVSGVMAGSVMKMFPTKTVVSFGLGLDGLDWTGKPPPWIDKALYKV